MDTYVARTPTIRTSRILVGVIVVAFVAALALCVALATRAISFDSLTRNDPRGVTVSVAAGYPAHYGLAGPSRVGPNAGSWIGYPPHYGLAGPSGASTMTAPIGTGAGYPAHNGLAGPSRVDGGR